MSKSFEAAIRICARLGARHFHEGRAYGENPYDKEFQPEYHLAWSRGHNEARAAVALKETNE